MEMKKKSVISFLLILSFLTALVPSAFAADNRHEIRGSYTYFPTLGILGVLDNQTETFTYCDDWFLGKRVRHHEGSGPDLAELHPGLLRQGLRARGPRL